MRGNKEGGGGCFGEFDFEIESSNRSKQPREVGWKYWEVKWKKGGRKMLAKVKGEEGRGD